MSSEVDVLSDDISILKGCVDWNVEKGFLLSGGWFLSEMESSGTSIGVTFFRFLFNVSFRSEGEWGLSFGWRSPSVVWTFCVSGTLKKYFCIVIVENVIGGDIVFV